MPSKGFFHRVGTNEEGPIVGVLFQRSIIFGLEIEVNLEISSFTFANNLDLAKKVKTLEGSLTLFSH